jgi:hypothetical protein
VGRPGPVQGGDVPAADLGQGADGDRGACQCQLRDDGRAAAGGDQGDDLPGFAGGYLLSRDVNGAVELTTHTFWESPAAIRAFTGDDITASVVEPEAQSVLLDFDPTATHRSVLVDARG